MMLYKYRGFSNLDFALDIFVNSRLYAANFQTLNDPMEGRFIYYQSDFDKYQLKEIRGEKARYNILSLSETPANMLMWSYYAEGHQGFVVGVEINDNDVEIESVDYVESLHIDKNANNLAKSILTKKLELWRHEKEHRVFKQHDAFVSVKVKELIFGVHTDERKKQLLSTIAKKFCPSISIKSLDRTSLETGKVDDYEV